MTADIEIIDLLRRLVTAVERLAPHENDDRDDRPEFVPDRADSRSRLMRLSELEHQLADLDPGDRARAIQDRMGISRTSYYRLRAALVESHESQFQSQSHVASGTRD